MLNLIAQYFYSFGYRFSEYTNKIERNHVLKLKPLENLSCKHKAIIIQPT